ncbi:hypothetical protein M2132_002219, partial [Dysgonomonas sp. PH5-45]|uniref:hypothetical protein n=1 Tax=unclassified Dysgonomonas TaxID=2630389 RepID=UPI002473B8B5
SKIHCRTTHTYDGQNCHRFYLSNFLNTDSHYKLIQRKRGELNMLPDSDVEVKIKNCENTIVRLRKQPEEIILPPQEPPLPTNKETGKEKPDIPNTINNNFNFLPLGVHQFVNKRYGKGMLFAGTQIGGGVGTYFLAKGAINANDKLRHEQYQSAARERELKNSRNWQIAGAAICSLGTVAMLWWNYCDNFDKNFALKPIAMLDEYGKPQMGLSLSFNF